MKKALEGTEQVVFDVKTTNFVYQTTVPDSVECTFDVPENYCNMIKMNSDVFVDHRQSHVHALSPAKSELVIVQ